MRSDEIRARIECIRRDASTERDRQLEATLLLTEAILELNQTMVFIKENTKELRRL